MDLLHERIKLVRDAVSFKKPERIPTHSNYYTYMILDGGYKLGDALYDYDKLYDAVTRFHEKYNFDYYNYTGLRNPFAVVKAVDGYWYVVDDKNDNITIASDQSLMNVEDYPALIADPMKYMWETYIPRKCKALNGPNALEAILEAADAQIEYNNFGAKVNKKFLTDYQSPKRGFVSIRTPFEYLFSWMRGIKHISIDLRRNYDLVLEACESLANYIGTYKQIATLDKPVPDNVVFGANATLLGHVILSSRQFKDIYYDTLKQVFDKCIQNGIQFNIFIEGDILRFREYLQDVPKGTLNFQLEQDDVFEFRKELPNISITGGMTTGYLGGESKEACIDYAKKLVDELGRDGGFIMGQNKMITYPNDARPENILAVQEFCMTYKG